MTVVTSQEESIAKQCSSPEMLFVSMSGLKAQKQVKATNRRKPTNVLLNQIWVKQVDQKNALIECAFSDNSSWSSMQKIVLLNRMHDANNHPLDVMSVVIASKQRCFIKVLFQHKMRAYAKNRLGVKSLRILHPLLPSL